MKILNIHDYGENKDNTAYKALQACEYDIINLQYDYNICLSHLFDLMVARFQRNFCDVVVGTGFGAFFAMLIHTKEQVPCVLINPISVPGLVLADIGCSKPYIFRELHNLECKYLYDFDERGVATIINSAHPYIDKRLLNYTKELLYNQQYYEVTDVSEQSITDMFKQHKTAWFEEACLIDFADATMCFV